MRTNGTLFPRAKKNLLQVGENIKLARLRRDLTSQSVAERAGISRGTLQQIERGSPTVTIGLYMQVLFILGLENDFLGLAKDDLLGRKIQDAGLIIKKRASQTRTKREVAK